MFLNVYVIKYILFLTKMCSKSLLLIISNPQFDAHHAAAYSREPISSLQPLLPHF